MNSLETASKKLMSENPDFPITTFKDILKKRVAPQKDSQPKKNQSVLERNDQPKKLKTSAFQKFAEETVRFSKQRIQVELNKKTDFLQGDLRLKLGDMEFKNAFTKENIEKFLVFDLGIIFISFFLFCLGDYSFKN